MPLRTRRHAVVFVGLLASVRPPGWRLSAWSAGVAAAIVGLASVALPDVAGSAGRPWGALVVAWGVLFLAAAEWEVRRADERRAQAPGIGRRALLAAGPASRWR